MTSSVPVPTSSSREPSPRRQRVPCRVCGRLIEIVRIRDHLRAEHQMDSSSLEKHYLDARIEARKARRSRP